jgi:hypothetical protein
MYDSAEIKDRSAILVMHGKVGRADAYRICVSFNWFRMQTYIAKI